MKQFAFYWPTPILVLGSLMGLMGAPNIMAAPPPYPSRLVHGALYEEQWKAAGGKSLDQYRLERSFCGRQIAMTTPTARFPLLSHVGAGYTDKDHRHVRFGYGKDFAMESSHYLPSGIEYEVAPRDVIPLFDQLYFVHIVGPESVNLKRVTENVPAEFRPQMDSRKISTADYIPSLFVRHDPIHKGRQFLDEVTLLNFDAKLGTVDVKLSPREIVRGIVPSSPAMPETHRVKKGELLTARGRSYKVLNVVPPQTITNVGKLVGWIELAADPEKEPAK